MRRTHATTGVPGGWLNSLHRPVSPHSNRGEVSREITAKRQH